MKNVQISQTMMVFLKGILLEMGKKKKEEEEGGGLVSTFMKIILEVHIYP